MRRRRLRETTLLDRVYEHVVLPPIVLQALDTAAFQRLRSLKQLGVSSFLYPGAVHTRFEHSIGVAHMARHLLMNIKRRQPELGITDDDINKAMLAGLYHDIGHGPFSHLFEDVITMRCCVVFNHEEMSERITRRVLGRLLPFDDVEDIIGLMRGNCVAVAKYGEIISNKRNGIDVDRLDYFIRDSLCCFGKPTVDVRVNRLFNSARLVCDGGQWQLAFEEKLAHSLRELFTLRAKLHKNVYQHHVVKAIGHMIGDVFHEAVPYFKVGGHTLPECAANDELLMKLGDWVLEAIESSAEEKLQPARDLIARLRARDIYRLAFSRTLCPDVTLPSGWLASLSADIVACATVSRPVTAADFIVDLVVINQGKGRSDPLRSVLFFNPKRPSQSPSRISEEMGYSPLFTPFAYEERTLMVFERRDTDGAVRAACERLAADDIHRTFFMHSLPFYNEA
ncbi:HD domain [Trypanosoma melophagium]|uniref:HD domain n=1 Tax=Trypanosoma melophagium TaxID=715481 RepID=UPI00351A8929|nr:HD domain [Trypanosoma melophagium]